MTTEIVNLPFSDLSSLVELDVNAKARGTLLLNGHDLSSLVQSATIHMDARSDKGTVIVLRLKPVSAKVRAEGSVVIAPPSPAPEREPEP